MTRFSLLCGCLLLACAATVRAQVYHNVVNQHFNTVANGPLDMMVVDVPQVRDSQAEAKAIANRVATTRRAWEPTVQRQLDQLRRAHYRGPLSPGIPEVVVLRQNGKLVLPRQKLTRSNDLTFAFVPQGQAYSFTPTQQQELQNIINTVYPELKQVYGDPSWSGTVTILNADNPPSGSPVLADLPAISGGLYNVSNQTISFAVYNSGQTRVLNLTQMMAMAFRGPGLIGFDAWERGMARAATIVAVRDVLPALEGLEGGPGSVDTADPVWNVLDRYDLLNQSALANDTFYPRPQENQAINPNSLAGMLLPRLEMATSAWLKVVMENPSAFRAFNAAYYPAVAGDASVAFSVPRLVGLMAGVAPNVEGLPFSEWYQRQYVLDTSATAGEKLYAWEAPLRPSNANSQTSDDYGIAVILVYYATSVDANNVSNETNLSGTCYPIYWDYTYQNRLFLGAQNEQVSIVNGISSPSLAVDFLNTLGGNPSLNGMMRITMDFTVNLSRTTLYVAPRNMGHLENLEVGQSGATGWVWGTVVGADTGKMHVDASNGVTADYTVAQGAFGGAFNPTAFMKTRGQGSFTLTFTNSAGQSVSRQVDVGYHIPDPTNGSLYGELATVFYASDPVTTVSQTIPAGPQMISFPIRPLNSKASQALLKPDGTPAFTDTNLLLAQYRQDLPGDNKYHIYPSMTPLTPGQGYWSNFPADTPLMIKGTTVNQEAEVSVQLLHGWNQIGNPFNQPLNFLDGNHVQFQYLADNTSKDMAGAIAAGWIVAQNAPPATNVTVWAYQPGAGYIPAPNNQLVPWQGYWIQVLVSEGVTITYRNPTYAAKSIKASGRGAGSPPHPLTPSPLQAVSGWSLPLTLRGPDGRGATAILGQADTAGSGYDSKLDALSPPVFSRALPAMTFSHPDWGAHAGEYFSEIHRTGSRDLWALTVYTPQTDNSYTLNWGSLSTVPRTTRLVLVDPATGRRQYLQSSSGYIFSAGGATSRTFQIVPEQRGANGLRVMNVMARPQGRGVGGSSIAISYDVSASAEVSASILGANGRTIRHLVAGRAAAPGTNQAVWDARDDRAVSVAAGTYLLQIPARPRAGALGRAFGRVLVLR